MSAIITNNFRRNSCENFINQVALGGEVNDISEYFIGIGKSDKWPDSSNYSEDDQLFSVPLPNGTIIENQDTLDNLISLVKIAESSILVPRNRWEAGRTYKVYDPYDPLTFDLEGSKYPCYMTVNDNIYVCLGNNSNGTSTSNIGSSYDSFDSDDHVVVTDDGYVWAFIQKNTTSSSFYTEQFIPVNGDLELNSATAAAAEDATGGLIYDFKIIAGGVNLVNDENVLLTGIDENGAPRPAINLNDDDRFDVNFVSGQIESIKYTYNNNINNIRIDPLMGYLKASIGVYDTESNFISSVRIQPLVAPINGFGFKPGKDLPSYYAGCYSRFSGVVDGEALVDTPIRQISLIKNPQRNTTGVTAGDQGIQYGDQEALDAVNYIQFNASILTQVFPSGSIIEQGGARVYVDNVDLVNDRIFYHTNSNYNVNYAPLVSDLSITVTSTDGINSSTITPENIDSIVTSEYVHDTGDVLFIDHRKKIVRNADQTEDIKIVIQF